MEPDWVWGPQYPEDCQDSLLRRQCSALLAGCFSSWWEFSQTAFLLPKETERERRETAKSWPPLPISSPSQSLVGHPHHLQSHRLSHLQAKADDGRAGEQNFTEPEPREDCTSLSLVFREGESQRRRKERLGEEGRDAQRCRDTDGDWHQEGFQRETEEEGAREGKRLRRVGERQRKGGGRRETERASCFIHGWWYYRLSENHIIVMGKLELLRWCPEASALIGVWLLSVFICRKQSSLPVQDGGGCFMQHNSSVGRRPEQAEPAVPGVGARAWTGADAWASAGAGGGARGGAARSSACGGGRTPTGVEARAGPACGPRTGSDGRWEESGAREPGMRARSRSQILHPPGQPRVRPALEGGLG